MVHLPFSLVRSHFTIMSEADISSPRRRGWFRFTLRTLLLATFLVALAASYMGYHVARVGREREVAAEIRAAGGETLYCYQVEQGLLDADPPGPWPIRWLFGDDIFAAVQDVSYSYDPLANDEALTRLQELAELRGLRLYGEGFTDGGVDEVLKTRNLQAISLGDTAITPAGLGRLSQLPQLEHLTLSGSSVTDDHAVQLSSFSHLESLQLVRTSVTDEGLAAVGTITGLRSLQLQLAPGVSDSGIAALAPLRNLETFFLLGTSISDESLRTIGELRNLRFLFLWEKAVTDAGVVHLERLHALETLNLRGTQVGDEGIAVVRGMPRLDHLSINETAVTDAGLMKLHGLKALSVLEVTLGEGVTAEGVDGLKAHLPGCTVRCWERNPITGNTFLISDR